MENNDFKGIAFNRHSIRSFDKDYKIDRKEMFEILEEATKAPSSVNLQPWRFVVVDSEEGKETDIMVIVTNSEEISGLALKPEKDVKAREAVGTINKK